MSNNEEGVKMVRMAAGQIESLCPQVINAARILAARPKSKVKKQGNLHAPVTLSLDIWARGIYPLSLVSTLL